MKLKKIITFANAKVALQFQVMERSLRATGCTLPIWVIPYDDKRFDLPEGSLWWEMPEIFQWLKEAGCHPTTRKYQCLTTADYQFVDADVCFLKNPEEVLAPFAGFISSCTEWNKPYYTFPTEALTELLYCKSSTWQKSMFSAGQFACDAVLYPTCDALKAAASRPNRIVDCLQGDFEQVGLNLLVSDSDVPVTNLTLPPINMESTWAGDYPHEYESLWHEEQRKPYLIHWAGPTLEKSLPINQIFYGFLSQEERLVWDDHVKEKVWAQRRQIPKRSLLLRALRRIRSARPDGKFFDKIKQRRQKLS